MPIYDEDRMNTRLTKWSGGSMILIAIAGLAAGFLIHALLF